MAKIDIFDALKNQDMVQGLAGQKIYLYSKTVKYIKVSHFINL